MFPFFRSCQSTAGFPLPAVENIRPLFILNLPSVNIFYALINITIMGMVGLVFYGTILALSKSGIRAVLIYQSIVFFSYFAVNILWFVPYPFIVLYYMYVLLLLPLDPLIRSTIANYINVPHSADLSMRLSFLFMTILWFFVGKYYYEKRREILENRRKSKFIALAWAAVVPLILSSIIYFVIGLKNEILDHNRTESPEPLASGYAKPYKAPEACYKIRADKYDSASPDMGDIGPKEVYSYRSQCFHQVALETLNANLCFEIRPVTTVLWKNDTYSVAKCRAAVKEKKTIAQNKNRVPKHN
jgi:hypothetical protein